MEKQFRFLLCGKLIDISVVVKPLKIRTYNLSALGLNFVMVPSVGPWPDGRILGNFIYQLPAFVVPLPSLLSFLLLRGGLIVFETCPLGVSVPVFKQKGLHNALSCPQVTPTAD